MVMDRVVLFTTVCTLLVSVGRWAASAQEGQSGASQRIFNTAKLKLKEGKQLIGGTVSSPDPEVYLAMANAGFDYLWIEMQHSPLTYSDVAKMIWACKDAPATPMNAVEGLSANLVTSLLVTLASSWGLPVSTTHVSAGAVAGLGLRRDARAVEWKTVWSVVQAWVVTLPACAALAGAAWWVLAGWAK